MEDHIKIGTNTRHYVRPPKTPDDDLIDSCADALREIIPEKLKSLIKRQDDLVIERENKLKLVDEKSEGNRIYEYLLLFCIEYDYLETYVIQKWLKYWLTILGKVDIQYKPEELEGDITEQQITFARDIPIEDLYDDQLRGVNRMVGICPFHEEKTGSFTIFADSNRFYCFGCNKTGDSIEFYMKIHNVSFVDAVKKLNNG